MMLYLNDPWQKKGYPALMRITVTITTIHIQLVVAGFINGYAGHHQKDDSDNTILLTTI